MLAEHSEVPIQYFYGLNTKQSKAIMALGFSSEMHDIDLSTPGVFKTRGGSDTLNATALGGEVKSIHDYYNPDTDTHYIVSNAADDIVTLDESGNISGVESGLTSGYSFSYVNYKNTCYCGNGQDEMKALYVSGSTVVSRKMGIVAPTAAPDVIASGSGVLTGDYLYAYAFENSSIGHISNASGNSSQVSPSSQHVYLSNIEVSSDAQVDKVDIYRTTNGGSILLYLAQINNGVTIYDDNIADTSLGSTQAPENNDVPNKFAAVEEWDGRIFGFQENSTKVEFSNDDTQTVLGEGLPEESFDSLNFVELQSKVYGIKKSPALNELWVHTSNGIVGLVRTGISEDPYYPVTRNTKWHAVSQKSIVNIDSEQVFRAQDGKYMSVDGDGTPTYWSYLIEPTVADGANLIKDNVIQAVDYNFNGKNQYITNLVVTGQTTPTRIFAANYRQQTPVVDGKIYPVWEQHNIASTALGVVTNSLGQGILYKGTADGYIIKLDTGSNDDGAAIDWSFSIGWSRTVQSAFGECFLQKILGYYSPSGNYNVSAIVSFDFGIGQSRIYSIPIIQLGAAFDTAIFDQDVWAGTNPLRLWSIDCGGHYKFIDVTFFGNELNHTFECHTLSILHNPIEGLRNR